MPCLPSSSRIPGCASDRGNPERLGEVCSSHTSRPGQSECAQCLDVDLQIDLCSLWMTMPQHLADLAERRPVAQHLGGQAVAELMGTHRRRVDASALKRIPDDGPDATRSTKAGDRRLCA